MRKHGGPPSRRDKHVTLAAISPPGVARGRFVGGQKSGLAGCKPPPLFTRGASSCSSQGRRQGEPWGASPRPSAPTYLPTYCEEENKGEFGIQVKRHSVWMPGLGTCIASTAHILTLRAPCALHSHHIPFIPVFICAEHERRTRDPPTSTALTTLTFSRNNQHERNA